MKELLNLNIIEDCKKSCTQIENLRPLQNQCLLITGGTGFMGKWLLEMISFVNNNYHLNISVFVLARNIEQFKAEVPHLANLTFIKYIQQDIKNLYEIPHEVNYIINAAGTPDSREHSSNPIKIIDTFTKGTNALLDASFKLPQLKKILHVSSHQVYGNTSNIEKVNESFQGGSECFSLEAIYTESKRLGETYCSIYNNQYRLPVTVVRPFAFIGPYQSLNKHWAINSFIRDGLFSDSIRILGNEKTVRSYLYGSDMAFWLLTLLSKSADGECYNMGSAHGIDLKELALKITKKINKNIDIVQKSSREVYETNSVIVPDIDKIKALGLRENYTLDEALKRTIDWNLEKK
jgi:nucleoside-diphosphate-sugar epimerase